MSTLQATDFTAFHRAINDREPFPWQQDLTARILGDRAWPDLVDIPTGLGKTTLLEIAVFVAAATAHETGTERLGRRRCFFIVDRRLVVDEVADHAKRIAEALRGAELNDDGVLGTVARAIRSYAPDAPDNREDLDDLLPVTRMRGGTTWAASWLDRPDLPGIVVGTVDQIGSRLFFRGYGVSDRRKPLDAALTGTDSLLLIDEAHLATTLTQTLAGASDRDEHRVPVPSAQVVLLTATANTKPRRPYQLDTGAHLEIPEARRRLTAAKNLVLVQTTAKDVVKQIAAAATALVTNAEGAEPARVLVVCNTVDRARAVHTALVQQAAPRRGEARFEVDLLIGRSRLADRAGLQDRILDRFGLDRQAAFALPSVLVATQTVEVGLNLDADGLVTESASWDALVQRLGRLNRLGRHAQRHPGAGPAQAVVVHDGHDNGPVYGAARDHAWAHLTTLTTPITDTKRLDDDGLGLVDVSPLGCRRLTTQMPAAAISTPPGDPVLETATLDTWVRTAPIPLGDPDLPPFLHGFDSGNASVTLAWRDGLVRPADDLDDPFDDGDVPVTAAKAHALLTAAPLRASEQVEVPIGSVRAWLTGAEPPVVSDLESASDAPTSSKRSSREPLRVLVWRGTDSGADARATNASWVWLDGTHADADKQIRPGDQIVVPSQYGGLDAYGWHPTSDARVRDVADWIDARSPLTPRLRVDDDLLDRLELPAGQARQSIHEILTGLYGRRAEPPAATERYELVKRLITALSPASDDTTLPAQRQALLDWLNESVDNPTETTTLALTAVDEPEAAAVHGAPLRPLLYLLTPGTSDRATAAQPERDDDSVAASSAGTRQVTLRKHLEAVRQRTGDIAAALRLPDDLTLALTDAARWHDLGKVEERFQVMLHDGDAIRASIAAEPLAKSGLPPEDRNAWRRARMRSALPPGARHEAWSAALVTTYLADHPYPGDADLLIHLIASHHGHARPWLPPVTDPAPRPITADVDDATVTIPSQHTIDLDQPARFARLNSRYGRWGLALLETIVRCADMTISAEGS